MTSLSKDPPAISILDTPGYEELRWGRPNRFTGFALSLSEAPLTGLEVRSGELCLGRFPADLESPDLAGYLPGVRGSGSCRFDFELALEPDTPDLELLGLLKSRDAIRVLTYPLSEMLVSVDRIRMMAERLRSVPTPGPELVFATQGTRDVSSYQRSIIGSSLTLDRYLRAAGVDKARLRSILDVGCGTGRLLLTWWLEDPTRRLHGCDINPELIRWGQRRLPEEIRVHLNSLEPPLPYPRGTFDMIQAVSVLTHLSLDRQRRWVEEFERLLAPGGLLLLTLHGELYVRLLGSDEGVRSFEERGYLEGREAPEGTNGFATFHRRAFARQLWQSFEELAFFPRGEVAGGRFPFPLASLQDVYLLQRS